MSLFLALLPILLYALYRVIKTNHEVKTFQASTLKKRLLVAETPEQIIEKNWRLEFENQEQIEAITRDQRSSLKTTKPDVKKFNNKRRGTA
jgi:hypothetical protein